MKGNIRLNQKRSRNVYPMRHTISQQEKHYLIFMNKAVKSNRRALDLACLGSKTFHLPINKGTSRNESFDFSGVNKTFNTSSFCDDYGKQALYHNFKLNINSKRSSHFAHHTQKSTLVKHNNSYKLRNGSIATNNLQLYQRYMEEGKMALEKKEYENAQSLFVKASKINSSDVEPLLYKGIALMYGNKLQEAIQSFNLVIKGNSSENAKSAYILLAMINKRMGNTEGALIIVNEALEKYKSYYKALIYRGKLLAEKKNWSKAKEDFKMALRIEETANNYWALFDCEYHLKNYKEAITAYYKAISLNKNVPNKSNVDVNNSCIKRYKNIDKA